VAYTPEVWAGDDDQRLVAEAARGRDDFEHWARLMFFAEGQIRVRTMACRRSRATRWSEIPWMGRYIFS